MTKSPDMHEEKIVWSSRTAPDGRELVTFGTPDWPVEFYGPWNNVDGDLVTVIPWHWHEELEINLAFENEVDMLASGKSWRLKPGQALFINSGVMHRAQMPDGTACKYYSIVFHPWIVGGEPGSVFWQKYLTPLLEATECAAIPILGEHEWDKEVVANMERIISVWADKLPGYEFIVRDALSRIIFLLVSNCLRSAPALSEKAVRDARRIKQMLLFIQDNYGENITTEQIAQSAAISVSECLRCFHSVLNQTPKAYLRQYRVQRAAQLLAGSTLPIAEIGASCGFDDMSYFARIFRAEQGQTPTEYRASHSAERPLLP